MGCPINHYWLLADETNRYPHSEKINPEFSVSMEEMTNFIGLAFMSVYNIRLSNRDYWSTDSDLLCAAFSNTISRNGFFKIKSYLYAANNQMLKYSGMAKVVPLYDLLNEKLNTFSVVHEDLSIDESMVPYLGNKTPISCTDIWRKSWWIRWSLGYPCCEEQIESLPATKYSQCLFW